MAEPEKISLAQLLERIDSQRPGENLSSALRLAVLADFRARVGDRN